MSFWLTQSLLSSYIYWLHADDAHSDDAFASFLRTLRREEREPTKAMQDGILFESMVNDLVRGTEPQDAPNSRWMDAARRFSAICRGGQPQTPLTGCIHVSGLDFVLYGVADYVKAGTIYDIKKVTRYEYGKYTSSPQHPMYLHLLPPARKFVYLIFDGSRCYRETYRRQDCVPVQQIISDFVTFLRRNQLEADYFANWSMTPQREEKRTNVYCV